MKRLLLFVVLTGLFSGISQAQEVKYFDGSWSETKAKAKAENKYIFVDCYTEWCGWCKVMDKKTMVIPKVYGTLSQKFIPVKIDMEKGEGIKLAMKYHVSVFPSFLFFNPDGEYVYAAEGYYEEPDTFVAELNKAVDKRTQFSTPGYSSSLDVAFPDFYSQAFAGNGKRKFPDSATVNEFLANQKDLFSEVSWGVISRFSTADKYTRFFLDNADKYKQKYGSKGVDDKVQRIVYARVKTAIANNSDEEFSDAMKMVDKYLSDDKEALKLNFKIDFYKATKKWRAFSMALDEMVARHGFDNPSYINAQCWDIYEKCDDKRVVDKACGFMAKAIKFDSSYAYLDTYACLLFKSGKYADAENWAVKAIAAGKKHGDDTKSTEELLERIKNHDK